MDIIDVAVIPVAAVAVEFGAFAIDCNVNNLPGENVVKTAFMQGSVPAQLALHIHKALFNSWSMNDFSWLHGHPAGCYLVGIFFGLLDGVHAPAELFGGGEIKDELFIAQDILIGVRPFHDGENNVVARAVAGIERPRLRAGIRDAVFFIGSDEADS